MLIRDANGAAGSEWKDRHSPPQPLDQQDKLSYSMDDYMSRAMQRWVCNLRFLQPTAVDLSTLNERRHDVIITTCQASDVHSCTAFSR
jgi:hypothetical protein